ALRAALHSLAARCGPLAALPVVPFLCGSLARLLLHSLPTRRSSDLTLNARQGKCFGSTNTKLVATILFFCCVKILIKQQAKQFVKNIFLSTSNSLLIKAKAAKLQPFFQG